MYYKIISLFKYYIHVFHIEYSRDFEDRESYYDCTFNLPLKQRVLIIRTMSGS